MTPRLEVAGVTKRFPTVDGSGVLALDNVSLSLKENEFVSLVGASGCGKSTLLSICAGLEDPSDGAVLVNGAPIDGPGRDRGLVMQSYTLFGWQTTLENVEFALRKEKLSKKERRDLAMEHLRLVGLEDFRDAYPATLSGGMQQRVALARGLCYRPSVLLMDEPFGALDALTRKQMQQLLTRVWESNRLTVLLITHDVEEAVFVADRVLVMHSRPGRIQYEMTVDLPRPRNHEMTESPEFMHMCNTLLDQIRSDAGPEVGAPTTVD